MNSNQFIEQEFEQLGLLKGIASEHYPEILDSGIRKNIKPRMILFHEGDPAQRCYLVVKGSLKLAKLNEQGREVIIRYIGPAELTAEIAVLKEKDYPVTAETMKETEVISWDKQTMLQLMRKYPDIAINMLNTVLERINDVQSRYLELSTELVGQRIARTLLRLMRRAGKKTEEGVRIDIPLSRQNIADYCGTTLYTASRTLSIWEKRCWIKSRREQITITDPHAIVMFAENE